MGRAIARVALLVRDYDEAIAYYTTVFRDLYGNRWDLLQEASASPP